MHPQRPPFASIARRACALPSFTAAAPVVSAHVAPPHVDVVLEYAPHQFMLRVSDDGQGIAAGAVDGATATGHWGVDGMRQRAQQAGGDLDIATESGHGTVVSLRLPLDPTSPR
jgi:nitrate/nitrite-specific signal transduction histidine kinase